MTHDVFWVTGVGIELPWAGMDKEVCKYLDGGCGGEFRAEQRMRYPIHISTFYPAVRRRMHYGD